MDPSVATEPRLLIAGGTADPNLDRLEARARRRGLPLDTLRVGPGAPPRVRWDLAGDALLIDGEPRRPAAIFLRHDVFGSMADPRPAVAERALAWYTLASGWALALSSLPTVPTVWRSRGVGSSNPASF